MLCGLATIYAAPIQGSVGSIAGAYIIEATKIIKVKYLKPMQTTISKSWPMQPALFWWLLCIPPLN